VNIRWHTVCSPLYTKLITAASYTSEYSSCMFSSIKSQSRYKRICYVSFSSSFFNTRLIQDNIQCISGTQPNDQSSRRQHAPEHIYFPSKMFLNPVHYEQTLPSAIHHTSNVSLQENVTPCFDLPNQTTFPLSLFCLPYLYTDVMATD